MKRSKAATMERVKSIEKQRIKEVKNTQSSEMKRTIEQYSESGASSWLSALPLQKYG